MVGNVTFCSVPELHMGKGSLQSLLTYIPRYGTNLLLITGASSFMSKPQGEEIIKKIRAAGYSISFGTIESEPTPKDIDQAVLEHKESEIDLVVAVGGGSAMDAGKAISAMLPMSESIKDYLEGVGTKIHDGRKVPFIAVPTTSGTGSESTNNAVIAEVGIKGFKKSLRHMNLVPEVAILDPELLVSCPKETTAFCGMDAFTQLVEAYLSTKANSFTDMIALEGIQHIQKYLNQAVNNGDDMEARTGMAYAAYLSGIALTNAGLGTIHGFAGTLGGRYHMPHGFICATLLGAVNRKTLDELLWEDPENQSIKKYANLGKMFYEIGFEEKDNEFYAHYFIDALDFLVEKLKIPKLREFGVKEEHINKLASQVENKNNPVKLGQEEIVEILRERL